MLTGELTNREYGATNAVSFIPGAELLDETTGLKIFKVYKNNCKPRSTKVPLNFEHFLHIKLNSSQCLVAGLSQTFFFACYEIFFVDSLMRVLIAKIKFDKKQI